MRDYLDGTRFGSGHCIGGEPTGDETPLDEWSPALPPAKPCRHCGAYTTIFGAVCIDCELSPPDRRAAPVLPLHSARSRLAA
ncbi:MAG TPA: hypothetical protein VGB53_05775 [Rubricoccaceae bacterium]|jgi:hypothetical protein